MRIGKNRQTCSPRWEWQCVKKVKLAAKSQNITQHFCVFQHKFRVAKICDPTVLGTILGCPRGYYMELVLRLGVVKG